jgi:hypothetical protein
MVAGWAVDSGFAIGSEIASVVGGTGSYLMRVSNLPAPSLHKTVREERATHLLQGFTRPSLG